MSTVTVAFAEQHWDELTAVLYQRRATPYERSLDVHISHLRKKLEREDRPLIRTVRGVGYQFTP